MYFTVGSDQCISLISGFDQCTLLVVLNSTGGSDQCISLVVLTSVFHCWF